MAREEALFSSQEEGAFQRLSLRPSDPSPALRITQRPLLAVDGQCWAARGGRPGPKDTRTPPHTQRTPRNLEPLERVNKSITVFNDDDARLHEPICPRAWSPLKHPPRPPGQDPPGDGHLPFLWHKNSTASNKRPVSVETLGFCSSRIFASLLLL